MNDNRNIIAMIILTIVIVVSAMFISLKRMSLTASPDPSISIQEKAKKTSTNDPDDYYEGAIASTEDYEFNLYKPQQGLGTEDKEDKEFAIANYKDKAACIQDAFTYGKSGTRKFKVYDILNDYGETTGYRVHFYD